MIIPYNQNPFEETLSFRLEDYKRNRLSIAQQFVKNLIAYCFYIDEIDTYYDYEETDSIDNQYDYLNYFYEGKFMAKLFNDAIASPITAFAEHEIFALDTILTDAQSDYYNFLTSRTSLMHITDQLINKPDINSEGFEYYLYENRLKRNEIDDEEIKVLFDRFLKILKSMIIENLLNHFSLENLDLDLNRYKPLFRDFKYHLNPKLLNESELIEFQNACLRWYDQLIQHFVFKYQLEDCEDHLQILRKSFVALLIIKPETNTKDEDIKFPEQIFKTAKAYLLFKTYAEIHKTKICISYLYRRMYEKDKLILVKDTLFREWFNRQDYLIKLLSVTETYDKAHTAERQAHVDLLYKAMDLDGDS
ncbi:hypothetical protein [Psychroflexus sp. ALD_RP9]|uniref:hypothetical protein n=1 Tax=Psychroflexus sp. ALD_RP9 TaxID=2777186 RepID=UPI001A90A4B6|nr:hypothetical protein [Psychroflexus sp. ALD_RP9]QSS96393.1 hypothetical protein IMZ30_07985 [Psychroflexus sp. ALD_RP9]